MQKVKKAVIPAAGMGTRFLPATKAMPKEMLPIIDKPIIQYVVEEIVSSGINDILIITGRGKRTIEDHFDISFELEQILINNKKRKEASRMRQISELAKIHTARQHTPAGLGDAVSYAKEHVNGEPFALLLGDDIIISDIPCTYQLKENYEKYGSSIIAVQELGKKFISQYGVAEPEEEISPGVYKVKGFVEKPKPEDAPSNLAIIGRYILTPDIFDEIEYSRKNSDGKEIQITDALNSLCKKQDVYASLFSGRRYDCGSRIGYLKAIIEEALRRDELKGEFRSYIKSLKL